MLRTGRGRRAPSLGRTRPLLAISCDRLQLRRGVKQLGNARHAHARSVTGQVGHGQMVVVMMSVVHHRVLVHHVHRGDFMLLSEIRTVSRLN